MGVVGDKGVAGGVVVQAVGEGAGVGAGGGGLGLERGEKVERKCLTAHAMRGPNPNVPHVRISAPLAHHSTLRALAKIRAAQLAFGLACVRG